MLCNGTVKIPADLDPADAQLRASLADTLRLSREARAISRQQIADYLGITAAAVWSVERARTTWEARTIMRYSRTIGLRIEWVLHGLQIPDDGDVMAVIIAAGDTSTPEREDRVHWRAVCNDLVRVRRAALPATALAAQLGLFENAVNHWEANPDGSTVVAAQRHARALGGVLGWHLHEIPTPLVHRTPEPRRAA